MIVPLRALVGSQLNVAWIVACAAEIRVETGALNKD